MKILLVHNRYQLPGGEDEVFRSEGELLRSKGHEMLEYIRDNDEIRDYGFWDKATLSLRTDRLRFAANLTHVMAG